MKVVVHLNDFGWAVDTTALPNQLDDIAALTDEAGFAGLAVADHLWSHPTVGGPETSCLEPYTTLSYLAARTKSVRLLTVVTGAHFRHPAVLAKTATTLDVLSGGRTWLGLGAGHYEEDSVGLGVPFPPLSTRYELLEDALEVCLRMWRGERGDDGPFTGHHVSADRLLNLPQTPQRPHPPILIAGSGERRTLKLVARYGDGCNLYSTPEIPKKLDVLRRHCYDAGTDFDRIERTSAWRFELDDGGPLTSELLNQLRWLAEMGIDTVIGSVVGIEQRRPLEWLARHVVPAAAGIGRRS
jgi:F420-dependent oxidoreductase-like protein